MWGVSRLILKWLFADASVVHLESREVFGRRLSVCRYWHDNTSALG